MAVTSLLELVAQLLGDSDAAAAFRASPDGFLADHGLGDLSGADVIDALSLGFESVAPDLAVRLVLPTDAGDASAADALSGILDAAPAESVLADAGDGLDLDFGVGDAAGGPTFGGGSEVEPNDLDLDLDGDLAFVDDLDTATFDQGVGAGDTDVDGLHELDDLDFASGDLDDDGPDGLL